MSLGRRDRLRIAFVYDALYPFQQGGAERRVHEIAVRLADRHDVHLVSWGPRTSTLPPELAALTVHEVGRAPNLYGGDGRRTIREAASFAARLLPVLLANGFDVIDCSATPYLPVYPCRLASRLTRTPMVVTWHEYWGPYWNAYLHDRPMAARAARAIEDGCRSMGDARVAVSAFTARRVADGGHEPMPAVVPNGVSLAEIEAAPAGPPLDVLFVGRLIADKHVDDLLRATAGLRVDGRPVTVGVVGDGPERPQLERLARELGSSIRFTGRLEAADLFGWMKSARMLVQPSTREGYGMTVVEAQAAGAVPVVVRSPMSAASELVRDGMDGLVCDPGPSSIRAAVTTLLGDDGYRRRLRDAAREAARARDWGHVATAMETIYRSLVAPAPVPATVREEVQPHV